MNKRALIIYYFLLLLFVGVISLPTKYNNVFYGQHPTIIWTAIILLITLPIYLIVLIIYSLKEKQFKQVLILLLATTLLICLPYLCYGKII